MAAGDKIIAELSALICNPRCAASLDESTSVASGDCRRFRAQFLGIADDSRPVSLGVAQLRASEAPAAMWEAISMAWPPKAIGFRLLDAKDRIVGRELSEWRTNSP